MGFRSEFVFLGHFAVTCVHSCSSICSEFALSLGHAWGQSWLLVSWRAVSALRCPSLVSGDLEQ
jgi:hypothetical protein